MMRKQVAVCGVPFEMSIVDGCVLFSDKAGFYGVAARYVWVFEACLWRLHVIESTFGNTPACHLTKMHKLLEEHLGEDHTTFPLAFKEVEPTC